MSTVFKEFQKTCELAAEKAFLHIPLTAAQQYSSTAIDYSYAQAMIKVLEAKQEYQRCGLLSGQRIVLALENRPEFFFNWLALNSLGCSVVPVNTEMPANEISYFLAHSEAVAIVCLPEKMDLLADAITELKAEMRAEQSAEPAPVLVASNDLQSLPELSGTAVSDDSSADKDKECALLYTSGSTGRPKACILSNAYFMAFGDWYKHLDGLGAIEWGKERLLTPLPLGHMNAMAVSSTAMIMNAGCIIQLDRFHPSTWWQSVRESKATMLHYLGVLPAILLQLPEEPTDDLNGQVKFGFGAGVNPKHHAPFQERFGFPLIESWAMTECGAGGCITANKEPRHVGESCFGRPTDAVEYQLIDEQGSIVEPGTPGELRVRSAFENKQQDFFSGYFKDPKATQEAWKDGWLNTGDVVMQHEDGCLHFVDRRKNVIRRSGENIAALEVEAILSLDDCIQEGLVAAVPDELRGDEVAACIVLHEGYEADQATAEAIVERCLAQLAYFKAPGYIAFCDVLPKTASNKPKRADVKILARQRVADGECFDTRDLKKNPKQSISSS
ncbi:MAG: AMP-binding protein [Pseudomonadales bacterium]